MLNKTLPWAVFALLVCTSSLAANPALRGDHPERYTVQPGDTLWDISDRFLQDSWFWPEIWHENPAIDNPHLIYPGDVVRLVRVDGRRVLTVERGGGTIKLSPRVRTEALDEAISTIPVSAIRPFLSGDRAVEAGTFDDAPYIVAGADERVMGSAGDPVYVRALPPTPASQWDIMRRGEAFIDAETGDTLGFEATHVGDARLRRVGVPATFTITASNREVLAGDRLLREEDTALGSRFYPRAPEQAIEGRIMAVMDGVSQIGQYDVVALNRGADHGLEVGHVLLVYKDGRTVVDRFAETQERVTLPQERAGELIVFRTFDRMSFGLVMEATRAMSVEDAVRSPR